MTARESQPTRLVVMPELELDWRFLLPDPALGRTRLLGQVPRRRKPMIEALERAAEVARGPSTASSAQGAVVFGLRRMRLREAHQALRPGGWIYLEPGRRRFVRRRTSIERMLQDAGFIDARVYWHWPSFASCTEIVPLDDLAAVSSTLLRRQRTGIWKIAHWFLFDLGWLPVLPLVAPDISVVAIRAPRR